MGLWIQKRSSLAKDVERCVPLAMKELQATLWSSAALSKGVVKRPY
jgi:hypothetical protein